MSSSLLLSNLLAYALQVAILAGAAALLPRLLRIRLPGFLLAYWQLILLACLALPLMQTWHPLEGPPPAQSEGLTASALLNPSQIEGMMPLAAAGLSWQSWAVVLLALGAGLRLGWLALGLYRLRLLRANAERLGTLPEQAELFCRQFGVRPGFYLSSDIEAPATFGLFRSHVVLPRTFTNLKKGQQRSILCHELLHLKRRDWPFVLAEEFIKSLLWFHPAIWWLTARIRLAREQSVDREVVRCTGQRKAYLDLLLSTAASQLAGRTALAPSFFRPGHLSERVASLIQEVSMSRTRLVQSVFVIVGLLLLAGQAALWAFPLELPAEAALPQEPAPPQGEPLKVGGSVMAAKLMKRVDPEFPELAKRAGVQGVVFLKITVNEQGEVWSTEVVRGHPLLNQAAVDAVSQWVYSPVLLNGEPIPVQATITVHFRLPGAEGDGSSAIVKRAPGPPRIRLTIDPDGKVWRGDQQLSDEDLDQLSDQEGLVVIVRHPDAPRSASQRVVERVGDAMLIIGPRPHTVATLLVESSRQALRTRLGGRSEAAAFAAYLDGRGNVQGLEYLSGPDEPEVQNLAMAQLQAYLNEQSKLDRPAVSLDATVLYVALIRSP
ncbi:MAG: M56 family metallopeptidase [Acidobacteriota bacterium]